MAQVKTIGEAVRNMSVHMANLYYYLTKAVIEDFGEDAKKSFERAIIEFGHERGKKIAEEVLEAGLRLRWRIWIVSMTFLWQKAGMCTVPTRMI